MTLLTDEQRQRAIEVMREYLAAPKNPEGDTPLERQAKRDELRVALIPDTLGPLVQSYLAGETPLDESKSQIDSLNKQNEYWGFKGIKGQMFFNVMYNRADDMAELDAEIKAAIAVPSSEDIARSRIKTFASYGKRIGEQYVDAGGSARGKPKVGSVPFFLSYFWQIQDRQTWPVYYTSSVNTMGDLNLWTPSNDLAADYIAYKHIHEELAELFTRESGQPFGLYEVEHVFWFKGGNPFGGAKPIKQDNGVTITPEPVQINLTVPLVELVHGRRLPESYVPPVVAVLSNMASAVDGLAEAAKASGTSLERAFEKHINAAFTILGYETKLLGQGAGRVPDGIATDRDNSYAIVWDAKVRSKGYSMGTDDRAIREYIVTQSRELKRRLSLRNIYYVIVSSSFADDYDDAIRTLKMDTHVNEVCLVEAAALVAMVDAKLRDPQQISLGPDGLQRLFSSSGVISAALVQEMLS